MYHFLKKLNKILKFSDGIFAVDALLARPGAYIRDPVLWQWQDDKGNWHTYGYNDCRVIEAAHVAGEEEVTLTGIFTYLTRRLSKGQREPL